MPARRDMDQFVTRLQPQDFVGVYAFPNSQLILAPTRDHGAVRAAIGRLTGHYDRLPSKYNLIESEIIGLTERDPDITSRVVERECGRGRGSCNDLLNEARALAGQLEAIGAARLSALGKCSKKARPATRAARERCISCRKRSEGRATSPPPK